MQYLQTPFELCLTESPNMEVLQLITERFDEIDMPFTNPKNPAGDKVRGSGAKKIWKDYVSHIQEPVVYQSTIKNEPNRMYAKRASCQGLPSKFRNTLYRDVGTDTDAVACHPTIAYHSAKQFDLHCNSFCDLVEHREERLQWIMDKVGWSRKQAKRFTNSILYGAAIPMEIKAHADLYEWVENLKKDCKGLALHVCSLYPQLKKDAEKRDKDNATFSALSCYLNNIENQIVLKAMEFLAQRGVKIYVYSFDGFLHSKLECDIYPELNQFIEKETGIPLRFIDKPMTDFLEFHNVLELKELVPEEKVDVKKVEEFDVEPMMEFDFQVIERYCMKYQSELEDLKTRNEYLLPIYKLCDYFFNTINDEGHLVVRHDYKMVHGKKMKKNHITMKFTTFMSTFCFDKDTLVLRQCGMLYKPCFSLVHDYLKKFEMKKTYPRINFYPSFEPKPFYNVFKGFQFLPSDNKVSEDKIKPFLDHIKTIWCKDNEIYYKHVMGLLAQAIQQPWNRWMVALILKSKEGAGKGIILDFIERIMGTYDPTTGKAGHFKPVKNQNDIFGQFTNVLEGCCMLFLDEMAWGGDKKSAGILKALITEKTNKIEHKNVGSYYCESFNNVVFASNEEWIVPAGDDTRRYFVLECDNKYAGIQTKESKEYFDAILNLSTQDVADYLYQYDLSGFNSKAIPITDALNDQKIASMESSKLWLLEELGNDLQWNEYSTDIGFSKSGIYERYKNYCKVQNVYKTCNNVVFWKDLKMMIVKENKPRIDGVQTRYVQFHPIEKAREVFKETMKFDGGNDWNGDE